MPKRLLVLGTAIAVLVTGALFTYPRASPLPAPAALKESTAPVPPPAPLSPVPPPSLAGSATSPALKLTPTRADRLGVSIGSSFLLAADRALERTRVQQGLRVTPDLDFRLEGEGQQITLIPIRELQPDRVYRFTLQYAGKPYQWSFQTQAPFQAVSSLPRNQSAGVPVNTGIEITFSHPGFADPAPFFDISPSVTGRFEVHRQTAAFVPNRLEPATLYTVRLRQGLGVPGTEHAIREDFSFSFETAGLEGVKGPVQTVDLSEGPYEYPTADAPVLRLWYAEGEPEFQVTAHRYDDAAAYAAALAHRAQVPTWAPYSRRQLESTPGPAVASFATRAVQGPQGARLLVFPQPLPPGYYLAQVEAAGKKLQARFQITDLAAYTAVTTTRTLFWLHDLTTGQPVLDGWVRQGDAEAVTGPDGVAILPTTMAPAIPVGTQRRQAPAAIARSAGGQEAVVYVPAFYYYAPKAGIRSTDYFHYLYTDRPLYQPEDVVRFWGVAMPRAPGAEPIAEVTVRLSQGLQVLTTAPAPVVDGTFQGSIGLPYLAPGWYSLQAWAGETMLAGAGFRVETYTKPTYRVAVTPDRRAVFAGETVTYGVQASYFEGTPVAGMRFNWSPDRSGSGGQVATGADGRATIRVTAIAQDYSPATDAIRLRSDRPEVGEITAAGRVLVFSGRLHLTGTATVQEESGAAQLQLRRVVLDRLNQGEENRSPEVYLGDAAAGHTITGTLVRQDWVQEEAGQEYDFVNKQVVKRYLYRQEQVTLDRFTLTTDAAGAAAYRFPATPGKSYELKFTAEDGQGGKHQILRWVYSPQYQERGYKYYILASEQSTWGSGETVALTLQRSRQQLPQRSGGFLFYFARLGLGRHVVQNSPDFRFPFPMADIPSTNVRGVYFDGRTYHQASRSVAFDPAERRLRVAVATDQVEYRPGGEVRLDLTVTDRAGQPVAARVNLSLVDEALFALQEQQVDLLRRLYSDTVDAGVLVARGSHDVLEVSPGGKGGDGGAPRADFQDAAFFATVTTDAAGQASATFRLPDNLTSWRLTYQAVTAAGQADSDAHQIPVRLPFFIDVVHARSYLAGDAPAVVVVSQGTALRSGDPVQFTVDLTGPTEVHREVSARAFISHTIPLGALAAGDYTLTVTAQGAGGQRDALRKTFTAVPSFLTRRTVDFHLLAPELQVPGPARGIATLTFTDYRRGQALTTLRQLRHQGGSRVEQRLSRFLAGQWLTEFFGADAAESETEEFHPAPYQTPQSGIAILPYATAEPDLTAKLSDLAGDRFDRTELARYFQGILDKKESRQREQILALYGLATLDRPVLLTIQALLTEGARSSEEQLYLGHALARLGDEDGARGTLRQLLAAQGERLGATMRLAVSADRDELLGMTALAAALAARLDEPEATPLLTYVAENRPADTLNLVEELMALRAVLPRLPAVPAAFTYVRGDREERQELKPGHAFTLRLPAAELAGLRFRDVQGEVGLTVTYDAPFTLTAADRREGFGLSREYAWQGDVLRVTLRWALAGTAPNGTYQVVDFLPAGLQVVARPRNLGYMTKEQSPRDPIAVNGQRVTFVTWSAGKEAPDTIVYYARRVNPGVFTAEPAILQHMKSGTVNAWAEPQQVTVQP